MSQDRDANDRDLIHKVINHLNDDDATGVVDIPPEIIAALQEDLEDLMTVVERWDEDTVSHQAVVARLRRDGLL